MVRHFRLGVLAVIVGGVLVPGQAGAVDVPGVGEVLAPAETTVGQLTQTVDRVTGRVAGRVVGSVPGADQLVTSPLPDAVPHTAREVKGPCRDHKP